MDNRPLSPHLQVYKPQLTSVLSIAHRGTGIFLGFGLVPLVWWLMAAATGVESYERFSACFGSVIGRIMLLAWTFSLFYHLCNGIRHLCWDIGFGFEMKAVYAGGWIVVGASLVLTLLAWLAGYGLL